MQWVILTVLLFTATAQHQAQFTVTTDSEGIQIVLHNLPGIYTGPSLSFTDFPFADVQVVTASLLDLQPEQVVDVTQVFSEGKLSQSVTLHPLTEAEADSVLADIQLYTIDRVAYIEAWRAVLEGAYLKAFPCEAGTWSVTGAVPCLYCWDCEAPSVTSQQCTLTSDTVCTSPCADGTFSDTGFEPCVLHSTCDGLIQTAGSATSDVECVDTCVPGETFSADGLPPCQACTECANGMGSNCLINQDAVCSDECAPGFWSVTGRGPCTACTVCDAPNDPYRKECTQYQDAECQSQCEAGVTFSETGLAPCQACDTCEGYEDCFAVCIPTRDTICSPKPCVDGQTFSETGYEPCNACSECDDKICAHCVADRDTVCDEHEVPCVAGETWSPSGYSPCTPCTEESVCGASGCYSSCIPTRDTVCNDECIEQETWSPTGREPCQACTAEEECGYHGHYSTCIPTRDTVCYPECEMGVSFSYTGQAPCTQCRDVCPPLEKVREACTVEHDLICTGDLCAVGTCGDDEFCDLRYGVEGICIPCDARPTCLDWTLDLEGFNACKDVCEPPEPTPLPTPTTTTEQPTVSLLVPCPAGGFSADGNKPCNVCTDCGALGAAQECTATSDAVCNVACEAGTFSPTGVAPCTACSTCVDGFYLSECTTTADAVCNPDDCADLTTADGSKWHDPLGEDYDCNWYADRTHCEDFGATSYNFGMNANEACCACGGGQTRPPTLGSTNTPTPGPTAVVLTQVCECATSSTGLCSSTADALLSANDESCVALAEVAAEILNGLTFGEVCSNCPQGQCVDVVPFGVEKWTDSSPDNCDCDWYDASDKNCALYGNNYVNYGLTAVQACCACGGGITNVPTAAPHTPTPTHHPTEPVVANEDCAVVRVSGASVEDLNGDYSVITWDANGGRPAWSKAGGNNNVDIIHPVYGKTNYWQLGLNGFVGDSYFATVDGDASLYPVPFQALSGELTWTLSGSDITVDSTVECLSETTTTTEAVVTDATTTTTTSTEAPTCDEQIDAALQENTFILIQQISIAEDAAQTCDEALTIANAEVAVCDETVDNAVADCNTDLAASQQETVDCNTDLAASQQDAADCQTSLTTTEADLVSANADVATCNGDLSNAQSAVVQCNSDLAQCDSTLTTTTENLNTQTAAVAECSSNLITSQIEVTTCNTDLDSANADLVSANSDIVSCNNDLTVANQSVLSLQSALGDAQSALDACCDDDTPVVVVESAVCLTGVPGGFIIDALDDDTCIVLGEGGQQEIAIVVDDTVYPTRIAYSEDMGGACPIDTHYCAGAGNTFGFRGNVLSALGEARTRANYKHPKAPEYAGVCEVFGSYWVGDDGVIKTAGVSADDLANLCYSDSGSVNIVTATGLVQTCVGYSDDEPEGTCAMDGYICSRVNNGLMVYGYPGQIAATIRVALEQHDKIHPQCPF